jgi:hypothetical protein
VSSTRCCSPHPASRSTNRFAREVLGGWQISQIYNFQTGVPLSVTTTTDIAGVGTGGGAQFYSTVPGVSTGGKSVFSAGTADQNLWFSTAAFVAPASGTFTPQHNRNILRAPGIENFNAGLLKRFGTVEGQYFTFRMEAFNFPNHPNWSSPDVNPTSSTFGRVTSKTGNRSMQASLRYNF